MRLVALPKVRSQKPRKRGLSLRRVRSGRGGAPAGPLQRLAQPRGAGAGGRGPGGGGRREASLDGPRWQTERR